MKVADLMEALGKYDPETPVFTRHASKLGVLTAAWECRRILRDSDGEAAVLIEGKTA